MSTTEAIPTNSKDSLFTELIPARGNKAFIVGQNGSGKSFLAEHLINAFPGNLAIIDPKGEFKVANVKVYDDPRKIIKDKPHRFHYKPTHEFFDNMAGYDIVYRYCYFHKEIMVYTDELIMVMDGLRSPKYLTACIQLGRSLGITMINGTQRPSRIPINIMSEAQLVYTFRLTYPDDVKKMEKMSPNYNPKTLARYAFYFFNNLTMDESIVKRLTEK